MMSNRNEFLLGFVWMETGHATGLVVGSSIVGPPQQRWNMAMVAFAKWRRQRRWLTRPILEFYPSSKESERLNSIATRIPTTVRSPGPGLLRKPRTFTTEYIDRRYPPYVRADCCGYLAQSSPYQVSLRGSRHSDEVPFAFV